MICDNVTLMETTRVKVTENELLRMDIIGRVDGREMTATQAAQALDLSVRQVRRLIRALREEGTKGLIHGNRGRPSPHRLPEETRSRVVEMLRTEYRDYNTSHARDELEAEQGLCLSYTSVRRLRLEAGLRSPKHHRVSRHRRRRERAEREGLLLQTDGSDHDWLEGRGPRMCLIAYIDDATGQLVGACFREAEDTAGYMQTLRDICTHRGVPCGVYTDRHTIFQSPKQATLEQKLNGEKPLRPRGGWNGSLAPCRIAWSKSLDDSTPPPSPKPMPCWASTCPSSTDASAAPPPIPSLPTDPGRKAFLPSRSSPFATGGWWRRITPSLLAGCACQSSPPPTGVATPERR